MGYSLHAGDLTLHDGDATRSASGRSPSRDWLATCSATARSASLGQGRMNVGQAVDRETALNDIELLTGSSPSRDALR